jgi:hypothetical protein
MELEPIVHVWIHKDNDLVDMTLTSTTKSAHSSSAVKKSEVLHTTSEHPFLTQEKGFLPAGSMHVGMHVLRADGTVGIVTGWKVVSGTKVMYNLEVAQDHTFTVGDGQWVVHNECNRGKLRNNLGLQTGDPYQGQHIIPCQLASGGSTPSQLVVKAEEGGLDINGAGNGIALPNSKEGSLSDNLPQHLGRHTNYTSQVRQLLNDAEGRLSQQYGDIPPDVAVQTVGQIIDYIRSATLSAGGGCTVDDLIL